MYNIITDNLVTTTKIHARKKIPMGQSDAVNQRTNKKKKDKHWSTKHYTDNERLINTNSTKKRG